MSEISFKSFKDEIRLSRLGMGNMRLPVKTEEPVHGGLLADLGEQANGMLKEAAPEQSVASWAMRWVKSLPRVQVILSGMSDLEQLNDNIQVISGAGDISEEDQKLIERVCCSCLVCYL